MTHSRGTIWDVPCKSLPSVVDKSFHRIALQVFKTVWRKSNFKKACFARDLRKFQWLSVSG